jgi:hypothetical protein
MFLLDQIAASATWCVDKDNTLLSPAAGHFSTCPETLLKTRDIKENKQTSEPSHVFPLGTLVRLLLEGSPSGKTCEGHSFVCFL